MSGKYVELNHIDHPAGTRLLLLTGGYIKEAVIEEWSPSGSHIKLLHLNWYERVDNVLEVLCQKKKRWYQKMT